MAQLFMLNILLSLLWMLMWGSFDIWTLLAGVAVGYIMLAMYSRIVDRGRGYGARVWKVIRFSFYFLRILLVANMEVAKEVITPGYQMSPRFILYPVGDLTALQLTSLANAITLTPGTLSADLTEDQEYLVIHCMYAKNRDDAVAAIDELRHRLMEDIFL